MNSTRVLALALASLTLASLLAILPGDARALSLTAMRARLAILELELDEAQGILSGDGEHPEVVIERGRLALYRGDCDGAVATPALSTRTPASQIWAAA